MKLLFNDIFSFSTFCLEYKWSAAVLSEILNFVFNSDVSVSFSISNLLNFFFIILSDPEVSSSLFYVLFASNAAVFLFDFFPGAF